MINFIYRSIITNPKHPSPPPNNKSPDTTTLARHSTWCSTVCWIQSVSISLNNRPKHG